MSSGAGWAVAVCQALVGANAALFGALLSGAAGEGRALLLAAVWKAFSSEAVGAAAVCQALLLGVLG